MMLLSTSNLYFWVIIIANICAPISVALLYKEIWLGVLKVNTRLLLNLINKKSACVAFTLPKISI